MSFVHPEWFAALLLLPIVWFAARKSGDSLRSRFTPELYKKMIVPGGGLDPRTRRALLLLASALVITALARPVIEKGEIRLKQKTVDLMVAFDISRSMFADDVYPNRFELARRKFFELLDHLKNTRVGVMGFSSRAFLIAPLTDDYDSLRYLVKHMRLDYVSLRGTDMMAPLEVTDRLMKDRKRKALLIFTDGGDEKDFSKAIAFAKTHGIKVFVYAVGTQKGGVMKDRNGGVVRDKDGHIVVVKLNPAIRKLAEATGGVYMHYSLGSGDMKRLAGEIRRRLVPSDTKERTIRQREELFIYPLALAIALFLAAMSSLPRKDRWSRKRREGKV